MKKIKEILSNVKILWCLISGLMITAVAGGGVVTPVIGFAIGTVGVIGGVFVTLACVCYLTYCAFGVKTAKA